MRKYQKPAFMLGIAVGVMTLGACGAKAGGENKIRETQTAYVTESHTEETEQSTETEKQANIFEDVKDYEFWFGSGAGAWDATLTIQPDGSFQGQYHDTNMGETGEDYPNGTQHLCLFQGTFTEPQEINEYTYSFKIASMTYENNPGEEVIEEGVRYVYSEPYGLDQADEIRLYLPEAPVSKLPQGYLDWVNYLDLKEDGTLGVYGLYNVAAEEGFSSYRIEENGGCSMDEELEALEKREAELQDKLENATTQMDMTELTAQMYQLWDDELNQLWNRLKTLLDEEEMEQLTQEERAWIAEKDKQVKEAGSGAEGGSIQPMLENEKAAELTKARVYELADKLRQYE